jgi:hypothetical protein
MVTIMMEVYELGFVRANPLEIFDWFLSLNQDEYVKWHPAHKTCKQLNDEEGVGKLILLEEQFNGFKASYRWKVVEAAVIESEMAIVLRAKSLVPLWMVFEGKKEEDGTRVALGLYVGFSGIGRIFDFIIKLAFRKSKVEAVRKHLREELGNLEETLKANL